MHAVLCAYGTMGNVLPFVGWGRALRARGHRVTLAGPENLAKFCEREQFDHVLVREPAGPRPQPNAGIRAHLKYSKAQIDAMVRGYGPALVPLAEQRDVVVAAPYWALGARIACERHRTPLATIYLQPRMLLDDSPAPLGVRIRRQLQRKLLRPLAGMIMARHVNPYRQELGLLPVRRPLTWWNSPDAILALFPDWFSPQQPIWPAHLEHVGFPLFDHWDPTWRSAELDRFLAAGDPPLVFSQSSNVSADGDDLAVSIETAKRLNRRAVILTTTPEQLPNPLPSHVGYFGIVPLSEILPRAAALVHHGGVGSLSQALAAGVPQVTVPRILDQFDNCRWLEKLGVSRNLRPKDYRVARVADELKHLLESREVEARCREFARRTATADPFGAACQALERLARGGTFMSPVLADDHQPVVLR